MANPPSASKGMAERTYGSSIVCWNGTWNWISLGTLYPPYTRYSWAEMACDIFTLRPWNWRERARELLRRIHTNAKANACLTLLISLPRPTLSSMLLFMLASLESTRPWLTTLGVERKAFGGFLDGWAKARLPRQPQSKMLQFDGLDVA